MSSDRAILLTPPGVAAIAVIRISGRKVPAFLRTHFSGRATPGRAVHGILHDHAGNEIDDPLVFLSPDQRFADINLHGGAWVVRATLLTAEQAGFTPVERLALPLAEAIDETGVIDAEIEAYLPLAATELAVRTLLSQRHAWSKLEANPDRLSPDEISSILSDHALYWLLHPPRVAIVGAANVGKSTIANRLFSRERSITADIPGTTRDWVGEMANLNGLSVELVDTPGIRQTADEIEREAIARSARQIDRADLVIMVLDASRPLQPDQAPLIARFPDAICVINKSDRPPAWDVGERTAIHSVATAGQGIDELMRQIRGRFQCENIDPHRLRWWTQRQREWLKKRLIGPGHAP